MRVGIPKETTPDECRVAMAPSALAQLKKAKLEVLVESGAGLKSGFSDKAYEDAGATIAKTREEVFKESDMVLQVRSLGANPEGFKADLTLVRSGQVVIATMDPLTEPAAVGEAAKTGAAFFAMELLPRITRAQSMDVLSSQANLGGYLSVLLAATSVPKVFPMMMTAAGTITPAKVFIVGAGVAGLQAIATARRLGAVVSAYDVRPAVKEQVESLGARFVEMELETGEGTGGYARAMDEEFYRKQRELMTSVLAETDVVITTAAIPGKKAPILVTKAMVEAMKPGSVVVDLAAERGGNCELTQAGKDVDHGGVKIVGPVNLPSQVAHDASQLYAKNLSTFLLNMVKEGALALNMDDEIVRDTMLTQGGEVVHEQLRSLLNLPSKQPATTTPEN